MTPTHFDYDYDKIGFVVCVLVLAPSRPKQPFDDIRLACCNGCKTATAAPHSVLVIAEPGEITSTFTDKIFYSFVRVKVETEHQVDEVVVKVDQLTLY